MTTVRDQLENHRQGRNRLVYVACSQNEPQMSSVLRVAAGTRSSTQRGCRSVSWRRAVRRTRPHTSLWSRRDVEGTRHWRHRWPDLWLQSTCNNNSAVKHYPGLIWIEIGFCSDGISSRLAILTITRRESKQAYIHPSFPLTTAWVHKVYPSSCSRGNWIFPQQLWIFKRNLTLYLYWMMITRPVARHFW